MRAVIMAGGQGTRLQPLTRRMPKPMLQLLDRPMMEYVVELLAAHEIRDITITVCYLAAHIRSHFGDGSKWGVRIDYQEEVRPLGTAGGIKPLRAHVGGTFLVMSGDGLTDFDLTKAISVHQKRRAPVTILLKQVACPLGYGVVTTDEEGQITQFIEKPKTFIQGKAYWINTGIYILEPEILDYVPDDRPFDFGKDLFPMLLKTGVPLYGYAADGYWSDVGTLQQYYQSQIDMLQGKVRINLPAEVQVPVELVQS